MSSIASAVSIPRLTVGLEPEPNFRSGEHTVAQDWQRLHGYLCEQGYALDLDESPRQFSGGVGNLNYLITIDQQPYVLRRPPLGIIPPGANDMAREHRVLSGLWRRYRYAPKSLLYCADPQVLGAHFLIMEYRPGLTIGGSLPADVDANAVGKHLASKLVGLLAALHEVEPAAVGLAELGNPAGFLRRATEGWSKRALLATDGQPRTVVMELVHWLRANQVADRAPTLLHCDFKLDNVVFDPHILEPRAVLDWDMSTRGDPLFDLATLLSYWTEAGDPQAMHDLRQMPTAQEGFPSRNEVVSAYADLTGCDVSDFLFYRVLAMFKLGVVFLQLHARYRAGVTRDERFADFADLGYGILDFTHEISRGRAF